MALSSVPPIVFTPTGLDIPTEAQILAGVQADYNAAFGGNMNPALNTPQGQMATTTAEVIEQANGVFAEIVNQVDPDNADGFMQDAIGRIYFMNRLPGLPTSVTLTCVGDFGVPIPIGSLAQDTSGNLFNCVQDGVIPVGGSIDLSFQCTVLGPTPCPANTVTKIYKAIPGWDTVNNAGAGVPGAFVESRAAFEYRRQQSVAKNASGSLPAIYAALFDVEGVIDVYATQNFTGATVNTGSTNFPIIAKSLYAAVVGGNPQDIAEAIWENVNIGCDFNGNTTETVLDTSGYSNPVPSYDISFEIPAPLPIYYAVQIQASALLPANIIALVQQAIVASFNGTDGSLRARIGSLILASKYYAPVSLIGPEVSILSILIGTSAMGATLTNYLVGIDQVPTIDPSQIAVALV